MADISFSPEAVSDLQQTKAYITDELCNEQAAVNTIAKITSRIRELAAFPEMGAPLSSIVDFETDYRFLVCGNYTAFYRFENQTVYYCPCSLWKARFYAYLIRRTKRKLNQNLKDRHLKGWRFFYV